jgi:hypothetical protein
MNEHESMEDESRIPEWRARAALASGQDVVFIIHHSSLIILR